MRSRLPQTEAHRARLDCAPIVVFLSVLAIILATAADLGLTYDERIYAALGGRVSEWLGHIASGRFDAALSRHGVDAYWSMKDHHPGFAKLVAGLTTSTAGAILPPMAAIRAPTALFFAVLCASLYAFLRRYGNVAALFGVASLVSMPRVFAHAHLLTLDVPVATMSFLATLAFIRSTEREGWKWPIVFGVLLGLALGCKLNAFFAAGAVACWWAAFHRKHAGRYLIAGLVVAPLTFVLTWPALWYDTWPRTLEYISFHAQHYAIPVGYFGRTYLDPPAPWHYPFVMTVITTPLPTLAAWTLGVWRKLAAERCADRVAVLLALCALVQLLAVATPGVPKYNGIRLFLTAFPFLCALGGIGVEWAMTRLSQWLERRNARAKLKPSGPVLIAAPLLLIVPGLAGIADVYPFSMSYYNELIGGTRGAVERGFEPTYWGESYAPALDWLFAKTEPGARILVLPAGVEGTLVTFYRGPGVRPDLRVTSDAARIRDVDYVAFHTRRGELTPEALALLDHARPTYAVRHDGTDEGVPLCVVYGRDEIGRILGKGTEAAVENSRGRDGGSSR